MVLLRRGGSMSWITLLGGIALVYLGSAAGLLPTSFLSFGDVGVERIASGLGEIPARLEVNLLRPATAVLERYLLIGNGPGFFSAGLRNFAGASQADQYVFMIAENGWLRTAAEVGVIGMLLYGWMLWTLGAVGSCLSRRRFNYLSVLCIGVALWANTHDLFNNYVMIWQGFLLGGVVVLDRRRLTNAISLIRIPYGGQKHEFRSYSALNKSTLGKAEDGAVGSGVGGGTE
jgi:hypothetical protein